VVPFYGAFDLEALLVAGGGSRGYANFSASRIL
jgi:hypothetical protein